LSPTSKLVHQQWEADAHDILLMDGFARQAQCHESLPHDVATTIAAYYEKRHSMPALNTKMAEAKKDRDTQARASWKMGAKCQIYSNSKKKWFYGEVAQIFTDEEGEWLEVRYDKSMSKQVQRYSTDIRPDEMIYRLMRSDSDQHQSAAWKILNGELDKLRVLGDQHGALVEFIDAKAGLFRLCLTKRVRALKENGSDVSARAMLEMMVGCVAKIDGLIKEGVIDSQRVPRFNALYAKVKKTKIIKPILRSIR